MAGSNRKTRIVLTVFIVLALVVLAFIIGRGCERRKDRDTDTGTTPAATQPAATEAEPAYEPSSGTDVPATGSGEGTETATTQLAPPQEPPADEEPPPEVVPEPQVGPLPPPGPDDPQ